MSENYLKRKKMQIKNCYLDSRAIETRFTRKVNGRKSSSKAFQKKKSKSDQNPGNC